MKKILTAAVIGAFAFTAATPVLATDASDPAAAQPAQQTIEQQPAPSTEQTGAIDRTMLMPGENSFTENQAKERIENAGFTNVGNLMLDDQGIWRATASKGALTVDVGLDFKGNVATGTKSAQ